MARKARVPESHPPPANPEWSALSKVVEGLKGWRPAKTEFRPVRAVSTIFPALDRATRVQGYPLDRFGLVHGPSAHGKTELVIGLGLSFLARGHLFGLIDAEYCYDAETEVLTRRGFVRWEELREDDLVGCWDPEIGSLVYERPFKVTRSHHRGRMYRVAHGGVDLLVTEKHKMFVSTRTDTGHSRGERVANGERKVGWSPWGLVSAEALGHQSSVRYSKLAPRCAIPDIDLGSGECCPIFPSHDDTRAMLRLIGFFVGDGWVGKERGRANAVAFTLKKRRKIDFLKELALELGWEFAEMANNTYLLRAEGVGRFFRSQFYDANDEKCIPEYLLDLNAADASAVLEGLRNSDGTSKRGAWEYSTTSEQVAQAVQRLVMHAGGAAHVHEADRVAGYGPLHIHRVMVLSRLHRPIVNAKGNRNTSWVDYDGEIFCAHTRTGILMIRRGGKPVLSGNTTPPDWLAKLMGQQADNPGFVGLRPKSYEQTVDAVREFAKRIASAKDRKEISPETSGLIVVDSLSKLVPEDFLAKIAKLGAQGAKGSVDGMSGRGGMMIAKMNAEWLRELTPLLYHTGTTMIAIARESEDNDPRTWTGPGFKIRGGSDAIFDSSLVMRVTRQWVKEGSGEDARVVGERHEIMIHKSKVAGRDERASYGYFHTSNGAIVPEGFDRARDVLELAREFGMVKQSDGGGWLSWKGRRWQGANTAVAKLNAEPAMLAELEAQVRAGFAAESDVEGGAG
jgi:RecA/RadA recombinase